MTDPGHLQEQGTGQPCPAVREQRPHQPHWWTPTGIAPFDHHCHGFVMAPSAQTPDALTMGVNGELPGLLEANPQLAKVLELAGVAAGILRIYPLWKPARNHKDGHPCNPDRDCMRCKWQQAREEYISLLDELVQPTPVAGA